jgi:3-hexulose-6-phosphate synthase/6-phospho-3-hexuloisomerase
METLGVDVIVHHIGFDERAMIHGLSPLDELDEVVKSVFHPGAGRRRSLESSRRSNAPAAVQPLVVVGAPLVIDGEAFRPAHGNLLDKLKQICDEVHRV